jgi:arylsulfatase A-like enzyme
VESPFVAKYYAMCEWFDETVGQLVERIEARGLAENTLFVYICDNGWIQKLDGPDYALGSKQSANEGGTRQPILFRWDGVVTPRRYDELVSSIDIAPTMLTAAGAEIPANLPGENLLPLIRDGQPLERDTIFGEGFAHDIADLDDPEASLLYRWAIQGRWKLLLTYDGKVGRYASSHPRTERRPQLFDLTADPSEEHNVAAEHPEIVADLAARIADWWPVRTREVITSWPEPVSAGAN